MAVILMFRATENLETKGCMNFFLLSWIFFMYVVMYTDVMYGKHCTDNNTRISVHNKQTLALRQASEESACFVLSFFCDD